MRHPHVGSRVLAGQRPPAPARVDRARDEQEPRALRRDLRRAARHARRGRLADERRGVRADRRVGDALRIGRPRPFAVSARRRGQNARARADADHAADARRDPRRRRHRYGQRRRACARAYRAQSARPGVHAARGARRPEARAGVRATARGLARARPHVRDDGRLLRDAGPRRAAIVPCRVGRNPRPLRRADRPARLNESRCRLSLLIPHRHARLAVRARS